MTNTDELITYLKGCGYIDVRELPDGSIACLHDLITTRAICLGCDADQWETRYCFQDRALASKRFYELNSENDVPEGFTASRHT